MFSRENRRGAAQLYMGLFERIREGLSKSRESFSTGLNGILSGFRRVDEAFLEELLELLILADVSIDVAESIIENLRKRARLEKIEDAASLKAALANLIAEEMEDGGSGLVLGTKPSAVLVIGVNGTGKTTSVGKLAHYLGSQGKRVLIAAADTFRAAAVEQLAVWAGRAGAELIKGGEGADPASVVYDAVAAAKRRGADVVLCDTAGRLHNKKHLMDELSKIRRIIDRELPGADKEVLLVIDATTGQNALNQAREFRESAGITGIVVTKLDGTAKGGMAIAVRRELGIPVKFVGVGEKLGDLQPFDAAVYARAFIE